MRIKLGVLFLLTVIVVASAGMGISYATDGLNTDVIAQVWCDVAFTSAEPGDPPDNEDAIDVGSVIVTLDPSGSNINVVVTTAYPGYEAYVDFTITNVGTNPFNVDGVVSENYDENALEIVVDGVVAGTVLGTGANLDGTATITVLQGAEQNMQYPFTLGLGFSNETCQQWTFVETVVVYANNPDPTLSLNPLSDGVEYALVATGTAWKYSINSIEFDAKYSITHYWPGDTWTDLVTGYLSYGPEYLDLFVNGIADDWGEYNPDHEYECTITGTGLPVELLINDFTDYYQHNGGSLTVDIYEIS